MAGKKRKLAVKRPSKTLESLNLKIGQMSVMAKGASAIAAAVVIGLGVVWIRTPADPREATINTGGQISYGPNSPAIGKINGNIIYSNQNADQVGGTHLNDTKRHRSANDTGRQQPGN